MASAAGLKRAQCRGCSRKASSFTCRDCILRGNFARSPRALARFIDTVAIPACAEATLRCNIHSAVVAKLRDGNPRGLKTAEEILSSAGKTFESRLAWMELALRRTAALRAQAEAVLDKVKPHPILAKRAELERLRDIVGRLRRMLAEEQNAIPSRHESIASIKAKITAKRGALKESWRRFCEYRECNAIPPRPSMSRTFFPRISFDPLAPAPSTTVTYSCNDIIAECRAMKRKVVLEVVRFFMLEESSIFEVKMPRIDAGLSVLRGDARQTALTCLQHIILLVRTLAYHLDILPLYNLPLNAFDICKTQDPESERKLFSQLMLTIAHLFHSDGMDMTKFSQAELKHPLLLLCACTRRNGLLGNGAPSSDMNVSQFLGSDEDFVVV